jgi:peptide deformylase
MYKFMEGQELKILMNEDITGITCDDVFLEEFDDIKKLGEAMINYCVNNQGLGLAAPQVGVNINMFVWMMSENSFQIVLNPRIFPKKKVTNVIESCLSSPGDTYFVKRHKEIRVKFNFVKDGEMQSHSRNLQGEKAFIFQHEFDHLIGKTIVSEGIKMSGTKEEAEEVS